MDKSLIVARIIENLSQELANATQAAKASAEEATHEEARPENKYDTRGLETSYLAGAQANYAIELQENLTAYQNLEAQPAVSNQPIALGSLFTTLSSNGKELFFLGPAQGGLEVEIESQTITVVTPGSPLGRQALGQRVSGKIAQGQRTVIRVE